MANIIDKVKIVFHGVPGKATLGFEAESPSENAAMPGFPTWFSDLAIDGHFFVVSNGSRNALKLREHPNELGYHGDYVVYYSDLSKRIVAADQLDVPNIILLR